MILTETERRQVKLMHIAGLMAIRDLMAINAEVLISEGKQQGADPRQIQQVEVMAEHYKQKLIAKIAAIESSPDGIVG